MYSLCIFYTYILIMIDKCNTVRKCTVGKRGSVAQWTTRLPTEQKIPGSTPGRLVTRRIIYLTHSTSFRPSYFCTTFLYLRINYQIRELLTKQWASLIYLNCFVLLHGRECLEILERAHVSTRFPYDVTYLNLNTHVKEMVKNGCDFRFL